jgi:hypothetical protein
MSNLPAVINTDMSEEEQSLLTVYKERGLPGIARVSDSDVYAWFNYYMSGKSYSEIADQFGADLDKVLMIATKYDWFNKKSKHLENIHRKIGEKTQQAALESAAFLTDYVQFIHKKLGKNINRFLAGDIDAAMGVSHKDLEKYFKAIESLRDLMPSKPRDPAPPAQPPVTININSPAATVDKPTTIEVAKRPLREIAEAKRAKAASAQSFKKK